MAGRHGAPASPRWKCDMTGRDRCDPFTALNLPQAIHVQAQKLLGNIAQGNLESTRP